MAQQKQIKKPARNVKLGSRLQGPRLEVVEVNGGNDYGSLKVSKCFDILISDAHEWISEIPIVPIYHLAKPQPREWAWDNGGVAEVGALAIFIC